jgi:hypothetical protein
VRLTCRCAAPLGGTNGTCVPNERSQFIPELHLTTQTTRLEVSVLFLLLRSLFVCSIFKFMPEFPLALDGFGFVFYIILFIYC